MSDTSFTMSPMKQGRMKYLILTVFSPVLVSYGWLWLAETGMLPQNRVTATLSMILQVSFMCVLGFFLILRKNHSLEVQEHCILHTDWRRRSASAIQANQIRSYRRNFMGELLLLDEAGKVLICVEPNMSHHDLFLQWLQDHHINESKKGDFR